MATRIDLNHMKIGVPVALYHEGTTAEYVVRALNELGHEAHLLPGEAIYDVAEDPSFEFFFCVDSGLPLDLNRRTLAGRMLDDFAFWFIDYRHNKDRVERNPPDAVSAQEINYRGGWVFQSQFEDYLDSIQRGIHRCSWLPLAADPLLWNSNPKIRMKVFDVGFIGNVWDNARRQVLQDIERSGLSTAIVTEGGVFKERAAELLRRCRVGFNISSFYGTAHAFDVNMRVFETLSCGIPLVTNWVPGLRRVFGESVPFVRQYRSSGEVLPTLQAALTDSAFLESGDAAREWVVQQGSYVLRMKEALRIMTAHRHRPTADRLALLSFRSRRSQLPQQVDRIEIPMSVIRDFHSQFGWSYGLREHAIDYPQSCRAAGVEALAENGEAPQVYELRDAVLLGDVGIILSPQGMAMKESLFYHLLSLNLGGDGVIAFSESQKRRGAYVALHGLWSDGFWHWIMEYLPRVVLAEMAGFTGKYIVGPRAPAFVQQSLDLLNISSDRVITHDGQSWWVESLWTPQVLMGSLELKRFPKLVSELRTRMLNARAVSECPKGAQLLYVSRSQAANGRHVTNEAALESLLQRWNVRTVHLETLSLAQQIACARDARVLIGAHGAGFVHAMFMQPQSTIIELFSPRYIHPSCEVGYRVLGHRYCPVFEPPSEQLDPVRDNDFNADPITADLLQIEKLLTSMSTAGVISANPA